jgi:hypothetical protein
MQVRLIHRAWVILALALTDLMQAGLISRDFPTGCSFIW